MAQLWVVDGDDTLWFVEQLYDAARADAALVVKRAGLDPVAWEKLERRIDVENVARLGVSPARFPTSCVQAYRELAEASGRGCDDDIAKDVRLAAAAVFNRRASVHPEAASVLQELRKFGPVALLTKGDEGIQRCRISESGLGWAFDRIYIVPQKDESTFREVLAQFTFAPQDAWSVGNSLVSDINPALRIGMRAVWVEAHVWEYERREQQPAHGHLLIASSLGEVPALAQRALAFPH